MQAWLTARLQVWRALRPQLNALERKRNHTAAEALQAIEAYRALGRDLSMARRLLPGSRISRALEQQYATLHALIHRTPHNWRAQLISLFRDEIPDVVGSLATPIRWITVLFVLSAAAGWSLVMSFPELVALIASEHMINGVQRGVLWTEGLLNVVPSSLLSVGILTNNIAVSLTAFCVGALFGLGTFYLIALNGLMLGGMFAFTHQHGLADDLFRFIIAHGVVELSVIVLAAAAGARLGESLIRPTHASRRESFQQCAAQTGPLLLICALLLIGCGFIEGYLSPDPQFPLISRVAVGFGYGAVMIGALTGRLFGRKPLTQRTPGSASRYREANRGYEHAASAARMPADPNEAGSVEPICASLAHTRLRRRRSA
jgi:uncharacterized membrane protein SpoIIM required for sporulation